ncbi:hypothetical protein EJB05_05230, partial [Eragrostis curvula]
MSNWVVVILVRPITDTGAGRGPGPSRIGVISGNVIFGPPLQKYWAEKQQQEQQEAAKEGQTGDPFPLYEQEDGTVATEIPRAPQSLAASFSRQSKNLGSPAIAGALKLTQHRMPRKAKSTVRTASTTPSTGVQYWLLKTEPGEWSWSDQAGALGGTAPWDGVRNHQAMNNLRAMRPGDQCLFYHSGAGAASRRVVGVVEVARPWYEGEGEDEKAAAAGGAVDVRAVGEFRRHIALGEIKKAAGEVEGMRDFALLRQPRLSVMPVPAKVWDWVCEMGGGFVQDGEVEEEEG